METFVKGRDVFAVLPTGYGKSLCFGCLPIVIDKLLGRGEEDSSIIAVVTPLTAIMKDQVSDSLAHLSHRLPNSACVV